MSNNIFKNFGITAILLLFSSFYIFIEDLFSNISILYKILIDIFIEDLFSNISILYKILIHSINNKKTNPQISG